MIAFDSCVIIDFLQGKKSEHTDFLVHLYRTNGQPVLPPIVIMELMSDIKQQRHVKRYSKGFIQPGILPGYWERAGMLRSKLRSKKLKTNTADALIAQFCVDHDIPLVTCDKDFRHYAKHGGLKLL